MARRTALAFIVTALIILAFLFSLPLIMSLLPPPSPANVTAPNATHPQPQYNKTVPQPSFNATRPAPLIQFPPANISNQTIENLTPEPVYNLSQMENDIHVLVNAERAKAGLRPLDYNPDIASVARQHSVDLAVENGPLTDPSLYCPRPFIHHEGFDFGLYESDRMYNRSIYYFSAAGENIFMTSTWQYLEAYLSPDLASCPDQGSQIAKEYSGPDAAAQVQADLQANLDYVKTAQRVNWTSVQWFNQVGLEQSIVQGWMASPGHRANILDPNYTEEGIGVAKVNDFIIVTEDFIERVDCGYLGASCCTDSGTYCYEPWQCRDGLSCS